MDWIERVLLLHDGAQISYMEIEELFEEAVMEVRALRKEKAELKERLEERDGWVHNEISRAHQAELEVKRLEKEKEELERVHGKLQDVFSKEVEVIERLSERLNKADSEIARLKRGDALLAKEKARNSCNMNDSLRYQLGDEVLKLFCKHGGYLKDD